MSYEIGKAAFNLQMTERVAHTEYNDNLEIVRHITGKDPKTKPGATNEFYDKVGLDYIWITNDGPVNWAETGRVTDMGHAEWMENGSDFRETKPCPFGSSEDVLTFNAVDDYGLPDFNGLVDYYEAWYQRIQPGLRQVISGGRYKTLVSAAIESFGWDMLLQAAGDDQETFGDKVLGSFFELSLHHTKAWAKTSIEVYMNHDDMVWTEGPFISPAFYRKYVFPRYKELWKPLKGAGKKVIFCSDGTFDMFLDDLVEAGADGFCFEPTNDFEDMVSKVGKTHVLIGGCDCRTLTFGSKDDVEAEVTRVMELGKPCPGFFFATGNHLPANIPIENLTFYFELVEELGKRD